MRLPTVASDSESLIYKEITYNIYIEIEKIILHSYQLKREMKLGKVESPKELKQQYYRLKGLYDR